MSGLQVIFSGELLPGQSLVEVRARIGQLFRVDGERLDQLFSGRCMVIKQGLDAEAAEKYRQAIERAGARCLIEPLESQLEAPVPAIPAAPEASAATTPALSGERLQVIPRDEYMAAFAHVDAPALDVAPVGADMQDEYVEPVPLPLDLSAFSVAPVGADMGELPRPQADQVPSTDHLSLDDSH